MPTPPTESFWEHEAELMYEMMFPVTANMTKAGAKNGGDMLQEMVATELGINWNLVNENAIAWAQTHTADVVSHITKTSMDAFVKEFPEWAASGAPMSDLIDKLGPYYGMPRAQMVAVTETTRSFAEGNIMAWGFSNVVDGFDVETAEDELVCPICGDVASQNPYMLDTGERPPFHVLCRCWLRPVLSTNAEIPATPEPIQEQVPAQPVGFHFPAGVNNLEDIRAAGGTTGARLVRDPDTGEMFIMKRGKNAEHLMNEVYSDSVYRAAGVNVPEFKVYTTDLGPVKLSRYIEDTKTLAQIQQSDPALYKKVVEQLRGDFALDALNANWDVVGLDLDNILVDKAGKAWRIDNGGSFTFRAQGSKKAYEQYLNELWTMRNPNVNGSAASVFGDLKYDKIVKQMESLGAKREEMVAALRESGAPNTLVKSFEKRLDLYEDLAKMGNTLLKDNWAVDYADRFAFHSVSMRKYGIADKFPKKLARQGVDLFDGKERWDHLRGEQSIMNDLKSYMSLNGGKYDLLTEWAGSQSGGSWSEQSQAIKIFFQKNMGAAPSDFFWRDGHGVAESYYNSLVRKWSQSVIDDTFTAWHAFNYEFLRNVEFENNMIKKGVIRLIRTEERSILTNSGVVSGVADSYMKRGAAESASVFKPVFVYGSQQTFQDVPYHRVIGNYFFNRWTGSTSGFFYDDSENEFVFLTRGVKFIWK